MNSELLATTELNLRYVTPDKLTIARQKKGRGFSYVNLQTGDRISDKATLSRIKKLVIPPAWLDVRISADSLAHIQAVGIDAKGRTQYLYHPKWTFLQQQHKFEKVLFFGEVLPTLREKVRADMNRQGLPKEKVVATIIWLLEQTFIRVGNWKYAQQNDSYGLTTLREKHVEINGNDVLFEFKGKSGVFHSVDIKHPKVARILQQCIDLPGYELFQYLDEDSKRHSVESMDVNEYLKTETGEEITAKDFRTWGGTTYSAAHLYELGAYATQKEAEQNIRDAIKNTASHLRNTPATSKAYYIHPAVPTTYQQRLLVPHFDQVLTKFDHRKHQLSETEYATWTLIKEHPEIILEKK